MKLSEDLVWRGLIKDRTYDDPKWLDEPKTFYLGIDASAASLTVGNLAFVTLARRLVDAGWQAVLVMGGGTSLVGDPGGKTEERKLISRDEVQKNTAAVEDQVSKLFSGENFKMVDNYSWLSKLNYLDFLRDIGKHFSMTELMQRDFVAERMGEGGSGISYAEFSYSLVQGYDFWHLFKSFDVVMQIGGSDQWGNMLSGVSMIRKKEGKEAQALSMPLVVNKATGIKFGKSESGAVWLDPKLTTPTQFYQFWINTDDANVEDYLKIFTLLPKTEIEQVMKEHSSDPAKRIGQTKLAEEVTKLVHGEDELKKAEASKTLFVNVNEEVRVTEDQKIELEKAGMIVKSKANGSIVEVLVKARLAASNSDARRVIGSGGVYINDKQNSRENFEENDFVNGQLRLRRGKAYKDSALVELE